MLNKICYHPGFRLIKVRFSERSQDAYTYVVYDPNKSIQANDYVNVPAGMNEDFYNYASSYEFIKTAIVTAVSDDHNHIPRDFEVKVAMGKVDMENYSRIIQFKTNCGS